MENKSEDAPSVKSNFVGTDSSVIRCPDNSEWYDFGDDLYTIPEVQPVPLVQCSNPIQDAPPLPLVQCSNPIQDAPSLPLVQCNNPFQDAPPLSDADEDKKIKALVDTPALDWQHQASNGFGPGRGFGRDMGRRMRGGHSSGVLELKTPPQGYICHRCKEPGHFIQHCPTNGDPNFDIKRVRPPTGIPRSMLMETPDGSYALPSGAVAVLKPNEVIFEKEIEGLPSSRSIVNLPPELHCPLCKEVMKDAALTSKCCFKSFCDKCIRDRIISKSTCVCGTTNILADDLLPNKTLRVTINRYLESNNSSTENSGSARGCISDMKPAFCPQPKIPSPVLSASKAEKVSPTQNEETPNIKETAEKSTTVSVLQQILEEGRAVRVTDVSKAMPESITARESGSKGSTPSADGEVHQKPVSGEAGNKKKKKKTCLPFNAAEMQWGTSQDLAVENYMMFDHSAYYNPYWTGMQAGMEGCVAPCTFDSMGYGFNPFDVPFWGVLPPDSFGAHGYMLPLVPPQRDPSRDREFNREVSSHPDVPSLKSKPSTISQTTGADHYSRCRNTPLGSARPPPSATPPKSSAKIGRADHRKQQTVRVFSNISFAKEEALISKKRKLLSDHHRATKNVICHEDRHHHHRKSGDFGAVDYGSSSDDDRHFKRRRSWRE
ncbi:E3 ubiquitin ligase PARAQUAT TOLERANCE 3-like isoform X2 [Cornus florida]|nr:E3 ubiquitin ligase PARAQUAT TOLERANCE 3-like isoform X2 [Cornus florida]